MKKKITLLFLMALGGLGCSLHAQTNFMQGWDGGNAVDVGSEPDKFGWGTDNVATVWTETDSEDPGTVRFSTKLASQCAIYGQFPSYYDQNRLLIMRWDGNDVNFYNYKLKGLKKGVTYKFEWMYCWYNNSDYFIPRVGINKNPVSTISEADTEFGEDTNDDEAYKYFFGIADNLPDEMGMTYTKKMTVHPGEMEFTVSADGDYYVTFTCTQVIDKVLTEDGLHIKGPMGMVGGFSVTAKGATAIHDASATHADVTVENGCVRVNGASAEAITMLNGMQVNDVNHPLAPGIYIVKAGQKQVKVVVD